MSILTGTNAPIVASTSRIPSSQKVTQTLQNSTTQSGSSVPVNGTDADLSSSSSSGSKATATFNGNSLNAYDQSTYSIRFSILSDDVNNSNEIIIAETGTTNLNILSLEMDSYPGPSQQTRNSTATSFELKIYEAFGANLPDLLIASAQALSIKNYLKGLWKISIKFQGYDPSTGNPNTSIIGRDWEWTVVLNEMTSRVNESGSIHTLSLMPLKNVAFYDQHAKLPQPLSVSRPPTATVGSALNDLVKKMNSDAYRTYGYAHIVYEIDQVPYRNPIAGVNSPFDHKIYSDNPAYQSSRSSNIQISGGTSIMSVIDHLFAASPTATTMIASASRTNDNSNTPNIDYVSTFHIIDTKVVYGDWNSTINDYDKKITYIIRPYETVRIYTNIAQANQSTDINRNQAKANFLLQNKYMSRSYDYIFTGNNTEVLNFDIELNFQWLLATDTSLGEIHQHQTVVAQSYNQKADARTNTIPKDTTNSIAHNPQNTDTSNTTSVTPPTTSTIGSRLSTTSKTTQVISNATYADDLATTSSTAFNVHPISISQGSVNHRAQVASFSESDWTKQRSVYGMLLDQLYDGGMSQTSMIDLQITIRGDPYWLGDDLDDQVASSTSSSNSTVANGPVNGAAISGNNVAVSIVGNGSVDTATLSSADIYSNSNIFPMFYNGEIVFVFRFNIPQGYDENTGTANIIQSEMYTGFYKCYQVEHSFKDGAFTQILHGTRIIGMVASELLNIVNGN